MLDATAPGFVRCIKPNEQLKAMTCEGALVMEQLKCMVVLELIAARRRGFATRYEHAGFIARYKPLASNIAGGGTTAIEPFVKAIRSLAKLSEQQCVIGKTKVFLKTDASAALETAREDALRGVVIQQLKDASKALDIKALDDALRAAAEIRLKAPEVEAARCAREEARRENAFKAVQQAIADGDGSKVLAAIQKAIAVGVPEARLKDAREAVARLRAQSECIAKLEGAAEAVEKEFSRGGADAGTGPGKEDHSARGAMLAALARSTGCCPTRSRSCRRVTPRSSARSPPTTSASRSAAARSRSAARGDRRLGQEAAQEHAPRGRGGDRGRRQERREAAARGPGAARAAEDVASHRVGEIASAEIAAEEAAAEKAQKEADEAPRREEGEPAAAAAAEPTPPPPEDDDDTPTRRPRSRRSARSRSSSASRRSCPRPPPRGTRR